MKGDTENVRFPVRHTGERSKQRAIDPFLSSNRGLVRQTISRLKLAHELPC